MTPMGAKKRLKCRKKTHETEISLIAALGIQDYLATKLNAD